MLEVAVVVVLFSFTFLRWFCWKWSPKKKIKLSNPRNKLGGLKFFGELKILTQPTIFAGIEPVLSSSATPRVHYHRGHAYGQLLYASECHHSLSLSLHMLQYPHFRCRTLLLFVFGRSWDFTSCFFFFVGTYAFINNWKQNPHTIHSLYKIS